MISGDDLDFDLKRLGYFVGAVVATALVVTAIYWGIYGMNKWTSKMQLGANLMMAAAPVPYQGQPSAPYQVQPSARTGTAGQYLCPRDGAVGLPVFDAAGAPHCPVCNQVMSFNGAQGSAAAGSLGVAAFGGG